MYQLMPDYFYYWLNYLDLIGRTFKLFIMDRLVLKKWEAHVDLCKLCNLCLLNK